MKLAGIVITAICCIALIASIGILMGHNAGLITGTTSAIVGIVTGCIAYYKGKTKGKKESDGDKETDSSG